jgi:phenylalanyl-tRNA synthetase beta subunit
MERSLTDEEINQLQESVREGLSEKLLLELR